jgi:exonuclease VII small subunit
MSLIRGQVENIPDLSAAAQSRFNDEETIFANALEQVDLSMLEYDGKREELEKSLWEIEQGHGSLDEWKSEVKRVYAEGEEKLKPYRQKIQEASKALTDSLKRGFEILSREVDGQNREAAQSQPPTDAASTRVPDDQTSTKPPTTQG